MKVGIYVRCSQDAQERATLQTQEQQCKEFCENQGWEIAGIYKDDGFGAGPEVVRPDFSRLLRDAATGKIEVIVVWKLDRFSRSLQDGVNTFFDLKKWGVNLKSATEPFDLNDPWLGDWFFGQQQLQAHQERKTLLLRFGTGKKQRVQQGLSAGGPIPYGYEYVAPGKAKLLGKEPGWYVKTQQAKVVKKIFQLYSKGNNSQEKIARQLQADYPGLRQNVVSHILKNPLYVTGKLERSYDTASETIQLEPIIDQGTWGKVQKVRTLKTTRPAKAKKQGLLSKLLICTYCGKTFYNSNQTPKGRKKTYHWYEHVCEDGKKVHLSATKIDEKFWNYLKLKLTNRESLERTLKVLQDPKERPTAKSLEGEIKNIDRSLQRLELENDRLTKKIAGTDNVDLQKQYDRIIVKNISEIKKLQVDRSEKEKQIRDLKNMEGVYKDAHKLIDRILKVGGNLETLSHKEKQKIIQKLYPRDSILYFPKLKMRGIYESPVTMKLNGKGVIRCEGMLDLDWLESSGVDVDKYRFGTRKSVRVDTNDSTD